MRDEEIIEKIQRRLNPEKYGGKCTLGYSKFYCFGIDDVEAIQGLLDLYQKEKEKNGLLIAGKFREVADKNEYIKDMYISKDKIREKMKELREIHEERDFTNKEAYYLDCYNELLEERN